MSQIAITDDVFYNRAGLNRQRLQSIVDEALHGADDGELFLEYRQSESLSFDDGRLKSACFDTTQGFGLRSVAGEAAGYAHASELSEEAIRRAAQTIKKTRPRQIRERGIFPRFFQTIKIRGRWAGYEACRAHAARSK